MIVVKLACFAPLRTELTSTRTVDLVPVARYGACAHIDDGAPDAAQVRHRVLSLKPRWALHDDDSDEGREVLSVLGPSRSEEHPPGWIHALLVAAGHAPATPATPVPTTWAEQMRRDGDQVPEWVLVAARNGWSYPDVSGAEWPDVRATMTGLSAIDLGLCSPPPGWAEAVAADPNARPWHLPGFVPPEGWTAPVAANVIVPEPATAAPADERFVPPPSEDDASAQAVEAPAAVDLDAAADGPDRVAIARDLAIALHISPDLAAEVIERAKGVPRAESGGPAPRGKINAALRSKGVSLDADAYNILLPILNLQS